jgi:hypothetical protein
MAMRDAQSNQKELRPGRDKNKYSAAAKNAGGMTNKPPEK